MSAARDYRPETKLVHAGTLRSQFGETSEALFLTQGYVYDSAEDCEALFSGKKAGYVYSRYSNPTVAMFEQRMAALEGAEAARGTASGMAAVTTALMGLVRAGDHVVAAKALFGGCRWVVEDWLPRFGVESTLVNGTDLNAWRKAVRKNTKVCFLETPTNPTLEVIDIAAVAEIAHGAGAKLVVDNVFATPLYQSPLKLGADCVVYSATKHIDGQGRCLGGVILGSEKLIQDNYQSVLRQSGPALSPFNAWVLLKGLETLSVRVRQQTETATAVADKLTGHPKLVRLIYPGRADHPQAAVIRKQMKGGSTLCAFEVKGGKAGAFRFLNALKLVRITNNLGDARSLITHPTTTTHQRLTPEQRAELGIGDGLVRFSAGLEHADDVEWQAVLDELGSLSDKPKFVVASGSVPPGVPIDFFARAAAIAKRLGAKAIVDTSGPALKAAIDEGVYLVKPNLNELSDLCGRTLDNDAARISACRAMIEASEADIVALTLGDDGALLVTRDYVLRAQPIEIEAVSTVGAGDSFLGGMAAALAKGEPPEQAFRTAVAAGFAAVTRPGTELARDEDVRALMPQVKIREVATAG